MNIALLVSELNNDRISRICQGAAYAAEKNKVTLVVIPGKKLQTGKISETESLYEYQCNVNYEYVTKESFDAVLVDIDEIGKNLLILQKEAFLGRFREISLMTLTAMEGFPCAVSSKEASYEQQGYEAVERIVFFQKTQLMAQKTEKVQIPLQTMQPEEAIHIITKTSQSLLQGDSQSTAENNQILRKAEYIGVKNTAILLYEEEQQRLPGRKVLLPEYINIREMIISGKKAEIRKEGIQSRTSAFLRTLMQSGMKDHVWIMKNLFLEENQLGIMVSEMNPLFMIPEADTLLTTIVTGAIRIFSREQKILSMKKELLECQEELARDDSVLDHIGDQDQMTGRLNRRGFFAAAYDRLKQEFHEGTYAVVAYVDIDSIKNINDIYGREEGDYSVRKVSDILNLVFGEKCIIGRIRGDEFAILLVSSEEGRAEEFRSEMGLQNTRLMTDNEKAYMIHLQFSICEFEYSDSLSLREMLMETDNNLKNIKKLQFDTELDESVLRDASDK